jgi:hypothetical protein
MKKDRRTAASRPSLAKRPGLVARLESLWLAPVEARPVRVFECLFTLTFLVWMGRCFMTWEEWLTEAGFHLTAAELASMGYPEPWPLLLPWQVAVLAGLMVTGGGLVLMNRWRRAGLIILFLCALYVQRADYMAAFTLNKLFVGIYALLAAAPGMWRDEKTGRLMQSAVVLRVLQATLILQYAAAGLAKLEGDWLTGHDILWTQVQGVYRTEAAAWALRNLPMWAWAVQQHVLLAFEVGAPVLFLVARLRPVAMLLGIGFHLVIALMMKDLVFFTLQMWTFYVLFFPARWWERAAVQQGWKTAGPAKFSSAA